jgi:hypothetical protein
MSLDKNSTDRLALLRGLAAETFAGFFRLSSCGEIALKKINQKEKSRLLAKEMDQ